MARFRGRGCEVVDTQEGEGPGNEAAIHHVFYSHLDHSLQTCDAVVKRRTFVRDRPYGFVVGSVWPRYAEIR